MKNLHSLYPKDLGKPEHCLIFDWGDTIMRDFPEYSGPMAYWPRVEAIHFALECLEALSPSFMVCLASNAGDSNTLMMVDALKRLDLDKYFNYFFTSKDLGVEKPEPDFFRKVAAVANYAENRCIVIGNDYIKDVSGSKGAGMKTIFLNARNIEGQYPLADAMISGLHELQAAIDGLRAI